MNHVALLPAFSELLPPPPSDALEGLCPAEVAGETGKGAAIIRCEVGSSSLEKVLGFGTDNYKWTAPEAAATAIVHSRLTFSSLGTQAAPYVLVVLVSHPDGKLKTFWRVRN